MVEEAAKRKAAGRATLKVLAKEDKKKEREREKKERKTTQQGASASIQVPAAAPAAQQQQQQQQPSEEKGGTEDDRFAEEPEAPGEEQQRAIVPKSPDQPTADQIAQHEASGHAVHRSWCVHCQRARKMVNPHYRIRRAELETSLPTLHMDYFFLGKESRKTT